MPANAGGGSRGDRNVRRRIQGQRIKSDRENGSFIYRSGLGALCQSQRETIGIAMADFHFKLPWEIQGALASGYAAYTVAYMAFVIVNGRRHRLSIAGF